MCNNDKYYEEPDEGFVNTDMDEAIISELMSSETKLWSLQTEFVYDENETEFNEILKLAIQRGEDAEIGRRFKAIVEAGMVSYLSMMRDK